VRTEQVPTFCPMTIYPSQSVIYLSIVRLLMMHEHGVLATHLSLGSDTMLGVAESQVSMGDSRERQLVFIHVCPIACYLLRLSYIRRRLTPILE
jgi:hypothetical protein